MSPIRRRLIITLATLLLIAMVPAGVMAAGGTFLDDDTSVFEANIEWLAGAGVTLGCNPSEGNTNFCPNEDVTRGQMAAFMQRFAQFIDAEDGTPGTADHADSAGNADTVDGRHGIDLQPARVSFEGDIDVSGVANGETDLATVEIVTAPTPLCAIGSFPDADILVRASGSATGLGAGEAATFWIEDDTGTRIDGTIRWIGEPWGSFAVETLYNGGGGTEEFTLVVDNSGYTFSLRDAQITAELIQDTRCEFLVFTTLPPSEPDNSTDPATD